MSRLYSDSPAAAFAFQQGRERRQKADFGRPKQVDGFYFGFLFRFIVGCTAVLFSTLVVFVVAALSRTWELNGGLFSLFSILICVTVLLGEHLRTSVYERVVRERLDMAEEERGDAIIEFEESIFWRNSAPNRKRGKAIKRLMDIVISLAFLMITAPLFVVVAALIKFDSEGPVIIRQQRKDFNGRVFVTFKFRTMSPAIDELPQASTSADDPRVTPVGRFLRRTSVDELPQLLNVLKGDLSLVGPRPLSNLPAEPEGEEFIRYATQEAVKPGITGWAQVHKLSENEDRGRKHDFWYVQNWSISLDLKILAQTVRRVLFF